MLTAARAMAGIAVMFAATVGVAVAVFQWRRDVRLLQLEDHYARTIAHVGEQVDLRYVNYRDILDAVTQLGEVAEKASLSKAQVQALKERLRQEEDARNLVDEQVARTQRDLRADDKQLRVAHSKEQGQSDAERLAKERTNEAWRRLDQARGDLATKNATLTQRLQTAEASGAARADAEFAAATARDQKTALAAAGADVHLLTTRAQEAAASAASALGRAQRALLQLPPPASSGAAPTGAAGHAGTNDGVPPETGTGEPDAGAAAAASALVGGAVERAERAAAKARDLAAEGAKLRDQAQADIAAARDLVSKALTDYGGALSDYVDASKGREGATQLREALQRAQQQHQRLLEQGQGALDVAKARHTATLEALQDIDPKTLELVSQALPSHRRIMLGCSAKSQEGPLGLCVARQLARVGDAASTDLSIEECSPSAPPDASFLMPSDSAASEEAGGYVVLRGARSHAACARLPLSKWIALSESPSIGAGQGASGTFDELLLLRSDGTVVYQPESPSGLRARALPELAKASSSSHMVHDVELATAKYRAFLHPIAASAAPWCDGRPCDSKVSSGLLLCGLVREDRLSRESYQISPGTYLWAILLIGFGVLALPLAKLWLSGPKARFRSFDVALLATSAVLVTLLGISLYLTFVAHNQLTARLDGKLREVSKGIQAELSAKLKSSAHALAAFTKDSQRQREALGILRVQGRRNEFDAACPHTVASVTFDGQPQRWAVCEETNATLQNADPEWNLAFWMNDLGYQQLKRLPGDVGTSAVSLAGRRYFQKAKRRELDCLESGQCAGHAPAEAPLGVPEIVRSATSGEIVLVVARPTFSGEHTVDGVAAVETSLRSFRKPVLPFGVKMAVIDDTGRVMLHSDNDAHQGQMLFDDVDAPGELRAALAAREDGFLELQYQGVSSRVHVAPIRGADWHLLAIAPTALVDSPSGSMMLITVVGFGVLVVAGILVVCMSLFVRHALAWFDLGGGSVAGRSDEELVFRPDGRAARRYAAAARRMIGWSFGACMVAVAVGHVVPLALPLAIVVLATAYLSRFVPGLAHAAPPKTEAPYSVTAGTLGAAARRLGALLAPAWARKAVAHDGSKPKRSWKDEITLPYALCCFGLGGTFIVVPATVLFMGAYNHVVENLIRAEQHHLAQELHYRPECLSGRLPGGNCPAVFTGEPMADPGREGHPTTQAQSPAVSASASFSAIDLTRWLSWPLGCVIERLPTLVSVDDDATARLYRAPTTAAIGAPAELSPWTWRRSASVLTLSFPEHPKTVLTTRVPSPLGGDYDFQALAFLTVLFATFLTVAHVVSFHSLRRLFFLDLLRESESRPTLSAESLLSPGPGATEKELDHCRILFLYPPSGLVDSLERDARCRLWDAATTPESGHKVVLVPHLEGVLEASDGPHRVATAAFGAVRIFLFSEIEPFRKIPSELRKSWAQLLAEFVIVRPGAVSDPPPGSRHEPGTSLAVIYSLWDECDPDEQRLLGQLAIDGYANPHPANADTLEHLVARGLVHRDTLTIVDADLGRFVRMKMSPSDLDRCEQSEGGSIWTMVRVPLTTSVAAVIAIFGASHPEVAATGVALVPTIAAGFPAVLRVLLTIAQGSTARPG